MPTTIQADLTSLKFPYNFSELSSCVVIDNGTELNRKRPRTEEAAEAVGLAHAYYMENVLPIARGFASISVYDKVAGLEGINNILEAYELRGESLGLALLVVTDSEQHIYDSDTLAWTTAAIASYSPGTTTVAHVKGTSYIFIAGVGLHVYDFTEKELVHVPVTGLDIGEIDGIFSAGAYLGAWSTINSRVFWSSIFDPTDFVPSLSTGAASTNVIAISSDIVTCLPIGDDFVIYTSTNAVSGRQTGNIQFPFIFQEIAGSGGIATRKHVAHNTTNRTHITWTPTGFQEVNVEQAQYIWPELRDGITRGLKISLDPLMERPQVQQLENGLDVRISYCGNSQIAISLRDRVMDAEETPYTEAYVYDSQLQRWGRLVIDHAAFFEFTLQTIEGRYTYGQLEADYETYADLDAHVPPLAYRDIDSNPQPSAGVPGNTFGCVGVNGNVKTIAPAETNAFGDSVAGVDFVYPRIFLGRYKINREQGIFLTGVRINKLHSGTITAHGHGYDGAYVRVKSDFKLHPKYNGYWLERMSADSFSLEVGGVFTLTDLSMECEAEGTSNQFAVPARKKFYSYINSVPYPIYVTEDAIAVDTVLSSVVFLQASYISDLTVDTVLTSGELRDIVITTVIRPDDFIAVNTVADSGTLIQTLFPVSITVRPDDFIAVGTTLDSGTLVQTLFPVSHTVYPDDFIAVGTSLTSGTLS